MIFFKWSKFEQLKILQKFIFMHIWCCFKGHEYNAVAENFLGKSRDTRKPRIIFRSAWTDWLSQGALVFIHNLICFLKAKQIVPCNRKLLAGLSRRIAFPLNESVPYTNCCKMQSCRKYSFLQFVPSETCHAKTTFQNISFWHFSTTFTLLWIKLFVLLIQKGFFT